MKHNSRCQNIRALSDLLVSRYDLSSLKVLGSVGEPINPEAWHWYHDAVGQGRCPVVDTFWQTETVSVENQRFIRTYPRCKRPRR